MFAIKSKGMPHIVTVCGGEAHFETRELAEANIRHMVQFFKNEKMKAPWGRYAKTSDFEVIPVGKDE